MKNKKKKKISRRLFRVFLLFTVIVLTVTTLMQTVFLDRIYRHVKEKTLDNAIDTLIYSSADSKRNIQGQCEDISSYFGVCVMVVDNNMNILASSEGSPVCGLHRLNRFQIADIYASTLENGGSYDITIVVTSPTRPSSIFDPPEKNNDTPVTSLDSILKTVLVDSDTAGQVMVMVNSIVTPLDDVVTTNKMTLMVICCTMLLLSLLLSLLFSRSLSRPVIEMNDEASKLAKSDFDVNFAQDSGTLELDELGEKLNYAAEQLSKVDNLRNELVANVSHDLRTPLTLISGYSEMMRDLPGENTPENLGLIIDETKRMTLLVNDILDVSRYRTGTYSLQRETFCLTDEVDRTINRIGGLASSRGFKFEFRADTNAYVNADRTAIGRVVYNLIGNALNYSGDSRFIEIVQTTRDGKVTLEVIDHGKGISQEEIPYVFDRYYRSSQNHVRDVLGSGMGLSIVKSILEMHDAEYGVKSALGKGSDFWFALQQAEISQ